MRDDGYHADGGHPNMITVIASAERRKEPTMYIMRDPETGRYHEIRPCGFDHWLKTYELIATVRMVATVEFEDGVVDN